jgi:outer membrane protein assembly factor BamA
MYDPFNTTAYQLNYWAYPWYDNSDKWTLSLRASLNRYPWFINSPEAASSAFSAGTGVKYLPQTKHYAYDIDFSIPTQFMIRNSFFEGAVSYKEQLLQSSVRCISFFTHDPYSSFFTTIELSIQHYNYKGNSYYSSAEWERGIDNNINLVAKISRRISDWFPVSGYFVGIYLQQGFEEFNGNFQYTKWKIAFEQYIPLLNKTVFAVNVFGGGLNGQAPIQEYFRFGKDGSVRSSNVQSLSSGHIMGANVELRYSLLSILHVSMFVNIFSERYDRIIKRLFNFPISEAGLSLGILGNSPFSVGIYIPLIGNTIEGQLWNLNSISLQIGRAFNN